MMRINRGVLTLALPLVVGLVAPAGAVILGGKRPKSADCYAVFDGLDATGAKPNAVDCQDGDPACDRDGVVDGRCTFNFTICTFQDGVEGCTPPDEITKIGSSSRRIQKPLPGARGPERTCGPENSVTVKLKKHGTRSNRRIIKLLTVATGTPSRDPDVVFLRCLPPAASPSGAFVLSQ